MIETHCHLNFPQFKDDLAETLNRAKENGITKFINIGAGLESTKASLKLAEQYPEIYATLGIHPCSAIEWNKEVEDFFDKQVRENKKVVGIGEIGIDYYRCNPEDIHPETKETPAPKTHREIQNQAFIDQIRLAQKHQKPFVIHCRNAKNTTWKTPGSAADDIWEILNQENYFNCVFHCYAEDLEFAQQLWKKEIYISFNGTITYPKNTQTQEVAKHCPDHLYILETDCPFLPPQSKRGQRNEPAFIKYFAEHIAELRNTPYEKIAEQTEANSKKLFFKN